MTTPRPNLVIVGASGGVATAFISILKSRRDMFDQVVLIDRIPSSSQENTLSNFQYITAHICMNNVVEIVTMLYDRLGSAYVLDLTDDDTGPLLSACDSVGFSYLNCSLNPLPPVREYVAKFNEWRMQFSRAVHVIGLGMNPGLINHFALKIFAEYGRPNEFIEFEFDSAMADQPREKPFVTWSPNQFIYETVQSRTGLAIDDGEFVELNSCAIDTTITMEPFIKPIKHLDVYPRGMIVPHDEIIVLADRLKCPGRFVYGVHERSFELYRSLHSEVGVPNPTDLILEKNLEDRLSGSDLIGMWFRFNEYDVCLYYDLSHSLIQETNATLYLVAVGAWCGLVTLLQGAELSPLLYDASDLSTDHMLEIASEFVELRKCLIQKM